MSVFPYPLIERHKRSAVFLKIIKRDAGRRRGLIRTPKEILPVAIIRYHRVDLTNLNACNSKYCTFILYNEISKKQL